MVALGHVRLLEEVEGVFARRDLSIIVFMKEQQDFRAAPLLATSLIAYSFLLSCPLSLRCVSRPT